MKLTAVSNLPPVTDFEFQTGAGFDVAGQSSAQTLLQMSATAAGSLDASLWTNEQL